MDVDAERKLKIRYCTRLWLLQEIAGCTFPEARIFLHRERNESPERLMEIYSLDRDSYEELFDSAKRKVAESDGDVFRGYGPMYPEPSEVIDW